MHLESMPKRIAVCLLATVSSAALPSSAQQALFDGITGGQPVPQGGNFAPGDNIIRWGPARFTAGVSHSLQYNDNVFNTANHRQWDLISTPQLNLGFYVPVTDLSSLSFSFGVGYSIYARNSELSRAFLAPSSALTWTIPLDEVAITFYDSMAYTPSPLVEPGLSGRGDYRTFRNTIGSKVTWSPDRWILTAGVSYQNYFSTVSQYDYLNSSSVNLFGQAGYKITSSTQAGLQVSMGHNWFKDPVRSDFTSYSVGPYVNWQLLESLSVNAGGGYVVYDYPQSLIGASGGTFGSYHANIGASHQLTDYLSHSLTLTRGFSPGVSSRSSQLQQNSAVTYSPSWRFIDSASLFATGSYEFGNNAVVGEGSTYTRWGASIGVNYSVTGHLNTSLTYQFYTKGSSRSSEDYQVNLITWMVRYSF